MKYTERKTGMMRGAIAAAVLAASTLTAPSAVTIQWGGAVWDSIFTSEGDSFDSPLVSGEFTFELGAFADGFTPTESNIGTWQDNWIVVDTFTFGTDPNFLAEFSFEGTGAPDGGGAPVDVVGDVAYVWGYNTKTAPVPGTEYVLYTGNGGGFTSPTVQTNDWVYPVDQGQQSLLMEWRVSTTGTNGADFGGIDSTQGPGVFTDDPGTFSIQTHTFIPEPSAAALLLLSGLTFLRRRRAV